MRPTKTVCPPHAGNNWALGYHQHGARCAEAAVERARREVERCDQFGGFVLLQSLAGGTGAGFGSRIAHELCDHMPSAPRLSCAVWPYETGEVIVQAYNALLSVEMLYSVCDGVLLLQNEELHATCAVRCARRSGKSACGQVHCRRGRRHLHAAPCFYDRCKACACAAPTELSIRHNN